MVYYLMNWLADWLMVHWLVADWLMVDWLVVLDWVLDNLVFVLEDRLVVSLIVSIAVSVEGLHESLGFTVLRLEEGVTELSEGGSKAVQLISQGISKSAANAVLGLSEGISLTVKEGIKPLL